MYKEKMVSITFVAILSIFSSITVNASTPCELLGAGNKYYSKDNTKAIDIYKKVEKIDRIGTDRCTASIYATIGTIYKKMADTSLNSEKSVMYYKLSSKYNRAFATALMCESGNCIASLDLWKDDSFWNR